MTYTLPWIGWGLYFAIVETMAIVAHAPGGTLSAHVWAWFGVGYHPPRGTAAWWMAKIRQTLLAVFMAWLSIHFTTHTMW